MSGVMALLQMVDKQTPPTYEYHSNEIVSILEDLLLKFKEVKKETDNAEFEAMAAHQKNELNMENMKKFAEKDKAEKEQIIEKKTEEVNAASEELTAETKDKDADSAFLKVVTEECETRATQWDQRSQTRSAELTAISKAIEALTEGVAPSYSANKKLVDVQLHRSPPSRRANA